MARIIGDDRRRLVPQAMVSVLTVLLDELDEAPSHQRVELLSLRARLCRMYDIPVPSDLASDIDVAQDLAEEDGVPLEP